MNIILVFLVAIFARVYSVNPPSPSENNGSVSIDDIPEDVSGRRSIGGTVVDPKDHPYLVGLVVEPAGKNKTRCTGVLVRRNMLITAAHCWSNAGFHAPQITVVIGSKYVYRGGTRMKPSAVITHPQYTFPSINDIAVVKLPVNVDARFTPMALPSPSMLRESFVGMSATLVGYGALHNGPKVLPEDYDPFITQITVPIISNDECRVSYNDAILDSNICIKGIRGIGGCFGDSGGPLFVTINGVKTLVGITSFSSPYNCAIGMPTVFSRVTSYYNWLMSV